MITEQDASISSYEMLSYADQVLVADVAEDLLRAVSTWRDRLPEGWSPLQQRTAVYSAIFFSVLARRWEIPLTDESAPRWLADTLNGYHDAQAYDAAESCCDAQIVEVLRSNLVRCPPEFAERLSCDLDRAQAMSAAVERYEPEISLAEVLDVLQRRYSASRVPVVEALIARVTSLTLGYSREYLGHYAYCTVATLLRAVHEALRRATDAECVTLARSALPALRPGVDRSAEEYVRRSWGRYDDAQDRWWVEYPSFRRASERASESGADL